MITTKVAFTKTFPVGMCWEKAMIEAELEPNEDPVDAIKALKSKIESMYVQDIPNNTTMQALSSIPYFQNK